MSRRTTASSSIAGRFAIVASLLVACHERSAAAEPPRAEPCAAEAARVLDAPAARILQALATCHAAHGKTASAWAEHLEAATLARREMRLDVERVALRAAASLEPQLATLAVRVPAAWDLEGLVVHRDGIVLERAAWGTAAPVDPGEHRVAATLPGKAAWVRTVHVPARPGPHAIDVGPFEDPPPAVGAASLTSAPAPVDYPIAPEPRFGAQRTAGVVLGVVGLAGLGVGTYYGVRALDLDGDDAKTSTTIATASLAAGGGALLLGGILLLTAPKSRALRAIDVTASPAGASVGVHGTF
ncbi:MAG: hypothetical protein KF819_34320 [Labilithrix sp.]|nr:hypothetical protein [Labilithrix sp.]